MKWEWSERSSSADFGGLVYNISRIVSIYKQKRELPYDLYPDGLKEEERVEIHGIWSEVSDISGFSQETDLIFWRDGPWSEEAFISHKDWIYRIFLDLGDNVDIDPDLIDPANEKHVQWICRLALENLIHRLLWQLVNSPNWTDPTRPTSSRLAVAIKNVVSHLQKLIPFPELVNRVASKWRMDVINESSIGTLAVQGYWQCLIQTMDKI